MNPRVYLVARPQLSSEQIDLFLKDEDTSWMQTASATNAEGLVELGGRLCYMSFGNMQSPRTNTDYIEKLIAMGHESVLEHVGWSFLLAGVSRAFTHQLVRHRVGMSFSQLSQQYHDESEGEFVKPDAVRRSPAAEAAWERSVRLARDTYRALLRELEQDLRVVPARDRKEAQRALRSAARSVLPNAAETKILMTANARALRHFLSVRGCVVGDEEMRRVATRLLELLRREAPSMFADFRIELLKDESPIVLRAGG